MSIESARAYVERMREDEEFRQRVEKATESEEKKKIILEAGLDFTQEELKQAAEEIPLSDDELETVAGGYGWVKDHGKGGGCSG